MQPGGSMSHSQGLSNNSYPESTQFPALIPISRTVKLYVQTIVSHFKDVIKNTYPNNCSHITLELHKTRHTTMVRPTLMQLTFFDMVKANQYPLKLVLLFIYICIYLFAQKIVQFLKMSILTICMKLIFILFLHVSGFNLTLKNHLNDVLIQKNIYYKGRSLSLIWLCVIVSSWRKISPSRGRGSTLLVL